VKLRSESESGCFSCQQEIAWLGTGGLLRNSPAAWSVPWVWRFALVRHERHVLSLEWLE
jgi:hypothetical protein